MILLCRLAMQLKETEGAAVKPRALFAEFFGTALLVFFGAGTATLSFGFKFAGRQPVGRCCGYRACLWPGGLGAGLRLRPHLGLSYKPRHHDGFPGRPEDHLIDAVGYWIAQVHRRYCGCGRPVRDIFVFAHLSD